MFRLMKLSTDSKVVHAHRRGNLVCNYRKVGQVDADPETEQVVTCKTCRRVLGREYRMAISCVWAKYYIWQMCYNDRPCTLQIIKHVRQNGEHLVLVNQTRLGQVTYEYHELIDLLLDHRAWHD